MVSDPQAMGMGQVGMLTRRSGGFLSNPALGYGPSLGVWWEQPYGLKELQSERLVASLPVRNIGLGVSLFRMGDDIYQEQSALISGCTPLSDRVMIGLSAAMNSVRISGLPTGRATVFNAGAIGEITESITAGFAWNNFTRSSLSNYQDELPTSLGIGALAQVDETTRLGVEAEQPRGFPMELRVGVSNQVLKQLTVRAGARFNPSEYTAGFSVKHRAASLHYALLWHGELGASHTIGFDLFFR